jgi:hypothetical protein
MNGIVSSQGNPSNNSNLCNKVTIVKFVAKSVINVCKKSHDACYFCLILIKIVEINFSKYHPTSVYTEMRPMEVKVATNSMWSVGRTDMNDQ